MLAKTTLDPELVKQAEELARRHWGPNSLEPYFAAPIEPTPVVALSRKTYLLAAAPQQEGNVAEALREAGFDVFLPREPKSVRVGHSKPRRTVLKPMLAGYVFPIFDELRDNWRIIHKPDAEGNGGIRGVLRLFLWGERPVPIPHDEIQRIRNAEIEKSLGKKRKLPPVPLKVGTLVQIIEHPAFGGWIGTVTEIIAEKWQAEVELDIFARKTPVTLSVDCCKIID